MAGPEGDEFCVCHGSSASAPPLPGADAAMGARRSGYDESQQRGGITRETWSIQGTPDGNALVLVWFESNDPEKAFLELAQDTSDFAVWFRGQVQNITGVDLSEPAEGGPELVLEWSA